MDHCLGKENGQVINNLSGLYDGMIGCVQRNEIDTFLMFVRPDSTPYEPGIFVTYSAIDDKPRIYSQASSKISYDRAEIFNFVTNFNPDIWKYYFVVLELSILFFALFTYVLIRFKKRRLWNFILKSNVKWIWNYFLVLIGAENLSNHRFISNSVLYTTIVVAIFYSIHLVLLNTLSSDLTVSSSTREIETLTDLLYDSYFKDMKPTVLSAFNMINVLKNSELGTDLNVLDGKMDILHIDATNLVVIFPKVLEMLSNISHGSIALIENSSFFFYLLNYFVCHYEPGTVTRIAKSKEDISPSVLSLLLSKETPGDIRSIFEYDILTVSEMSLINGAYKSTGMFETMMGPPKDRISTEICKEHCDGTFMTHLESDWKPFALKPFHNLILMSTTIFIIALIILFAEHIIFTIDSCCGNSSRSKYVENRNRSLKYSIQFHNRLIFGNLFDVNMSEYVRNRRVYPMSHDAYRYYRRKKLNMLTNVN